MICALLGAAALAGMGAIMRGDSIVFVITAILLLTITGFYKLTIKIDNEKLRASFGIGLIQRTIPISEITVCEPIRIRWWYGWGIHFTSYGWLYNVSGWDAVAIALRDGRKFALGTNDPQGIATAIRRFASAR